MNPLKGPGGFGRVVNGFMNIIMCAILSVYVLWTVQNLPGNEALPIFTPLGFFVSFVTSFCVGEFVGDHVPALAWGQKLAAALHVKNKVGAHFISVAVLALVMITSISYVCTWINNVQVAGWDGTFAAWIMVYPFLLASGYVVELVMLPVAMKLAAAVSGFDPSKAPAPAEA
ncbi:hypothetical protein [Gordonibacter sp. 28C]|uniref:hypothetical protein n=1 Tax=Gordonibacter sp. 28C TaxID=2078569 RepID=UPI001F547A9B|nr:hypothetical protein [Gordonibacter sp. 28C]